MASTDQVTIAIGKAFDRYDKDGSGSVDAGELAGLCATLGSPLPPSMLETAMKYLDRDGSGRIEKGEFISWWTSRGGDLNADGKVDAVESQLARVSLRGTDDALRSHIEDIRFERDSLHREILRLQEEKAAIQKAASELTEQLGRLNESLAENHHHRAQLDSVIMETEGAYVKILEGSRALVETVRTATPRLPDPYAMGPPADG